MQLLRKYPTAAMFLSFFAASCALAYGTFPVRMAVATAALLALTCAVLKLPRRVAVLEDALLRSALILAASAVLAAGLWSVLWNDFYAESIDRHAVEEDHLTVRVLSCESSVSWAARYRVSVVSSGTLPAGTGILLETGPSQYRPGALLEGEAVYSSLEDMDTASWNTARSRRADRVFLAAEGSFLETGFRRLLTPSALFASLNSRLSSLLTAHAGRDAGGLGAALLLGNRESVSGSLTRDFRRLGVSHLLVVSGTHFSVLVSFLSAFLKKTMLHRRRRALLTIAFIVFFMLLAGASPSVVRAGIMHLLIQLAVLFSKKAQTVNSFALSGALLVLFNPFSAASSF